jgi:protein-L-isoaspartate(D-aspartate) O-methyltransferase
MDNYQQRRAAMVSEQLRARGIRDPRVLEAMATVPREQFVPSTLSSHAYDDQPLPIQAGQTISQPYIVAFMTEAAQIAPDARVLEIGTGSGYAAAVLSLLAAEVFTVERHAQLAQSASERMTRLQYTNVHVITSDGTRGLPDHAPFDAILVTASGPDIPAALLEQLSIGGRLVMPVERRHGHQQLVVVVRAMEDDFVEEAVLGVAFVPLIGEFGHPERS